MAIQKGLIKLSGKLGDLVFYAQNKKSLVRRKGAAAQLSEASKKAGKDFGEASKNATYVRKAFAQAVKFYGYDDLIGRLNKRFVEILNTIPKVQQGNKKLIDGHFELLKGFEFNNDTSINQLLYHLPTVTMEENGMLHMSLPKLPVAQLLQHLPGAAAYQLQLMVFNFDLDGENYEVFKINPICRAFEQLNFPGAQLAIPTDQKGEKALVIAFGICYIKDGAVSNDRKYYACQIIEAKHLKDGLAVEFVPAAAPELAPKEEDEQAGLNWEMGEEDDDSIV